METTAVVCAHEHRTACVIIMEVAMRACASATLVTVANTAAWHVLALTDPIQTPSVVRGENVTLLGSASAMSGGSVTYTAVKRANMPALESSKKTPRPRGHVRHVMAMDPAVKQHVHVTTTSQVTHARTSARRTVLVHTAVDMDTVTQVLTSVPVIPTTRMYYATKPAC